jgi:hypothetical protein
VTEKSDGEPPDESDPDQKVGYKQPPADKQFKKGKSGNPRGRPKQNDGVPAADPSIFEFLADKETHRKITVRDGNKPQKMPAFQAAMRRAVLKAANGDHKSLVFVAGHAQAHAEKKKAIAFGQFQAAVLLKANWEKEVADCERLGKPRPKDRLPHPDEIAIDGRTGRVSYNGPFNEKEEAEWERLLVGKAEAKLEITKLRRAAKRPGANKQECEALIAINQETYDLVHATIPDKEMRRRPDFDILKWRDDQRKALKIFRQLRAERAAADAEGK